MKKRFAVSFLFAFVAAACGSGSPDKGSAAPPAPATITGQAAEPAPVPSAPADFWRSDFTKLDGWNDAKIDPSLQATLSLTGDGKIKLTESGDQEWGKASTLLKGVEFDRLPMLEVKVADAAGAKWGIGVAPIAPSGAGWVDGEYKTAVEWQEQAGTKTIDLGKVSGLTGRKDVWIVLLVANEKASVIFESLKVTYSK